MTKITAALAALLCIFLVACSAHTEEATNVSTSSATLNSVFEWDAGDGPGETWYEARNEGGAWTEVPGSRNSFNDLPNTSTYPYAYNWTGISAGVREYRLCGYGDKDDPNNNIACFDRNAFPHAQNVSTYNYNVFTTSNTCDKVVSAGTSYATAISGVGSGDTLCLNAGAYSWGQVTPPTNVRILGRGDDVVITGGFDITNDDVTLENFRLELGAGIGPAAIFIDSNDVTTRRLNVDVNNLAAQGYIVGNGGAQTDGVRILDTVVHNVRGGAACGQANGHQFYHAIYWANGINGSLSRLWLYDNGGFGLHFYSGAGGSAANTIVNQVVTDDSVCSFGNVFDDISGPTSFLNTVVTDSGPWSCRTSGSTIVASRAQSGFSGCTGSGNTTADTTYSNEGARDYRVPGNAAFQYVPGPKG